MTRFIDFVCADPALAASREAFALSSAGSDGDSGRAAYRRLHSWSISRPEEFWPALWRFCDVQAQLGPGGEQWQQAAVGIDKMRPPVLSEGDTEANTDIGPQWFTGAHLNFAENLLRFRDEKTALLSYNELGRQRSLTFAELYSAVHDMQQALIAQGVTVGDRVAGFMPNIPEAVIAMLATASLGAIWTSCSPDFGVKGVLDRFGQIRPKLLIAADGYLYNGKVIDSLPRVREFAVELEELQRIVVVPYMHETPAIAGMPATVLYRDFVDEARSPSAPANIEFARLPFHHPLYIMYSSGTTGLPKCMVHGAGGTLIQHLKELALHTDLTRDDTIFYFTTCGWMMWNWLVSSLAVGATVVLYDGSPFAPTPASLWDMAQEAGVSVFGTSAKYLALLEKQGVKPRESHTLGRLRAVLSTGSPLAPESFDYVYRDIRADLQLASISGGTDIISCFALGCPIAPVNRGELQCLGLGMAVDVYDESGSPLRSAPGELVCKQPFPSMPVYFWNDPDGSKYRSAYFDVYPGVWRHGDWVELTENGGLIIYGRSDATLNPGGVRIGTAEIYNVVDQFPEVLESLVVGQDWEGDVRIVLFVRMQPDRELNDELRLLIQKAVREQASPFHVPKKIIAVEDIPRTISGKIVELAVRNVIHGKDVKNIDALANPSALELFRELDELRN